MRSKLLVIFIALEFAAGHVAFTFAGRGSTQAAVATAARVLQVSEDVVEKKIEFEMAETKDDKLWFELSDAEDGRVKIRGTSGPDLTAGLGMYLSEKYQFSMSWNRTGGKLLSRAFELEKQARKVGKNTVHNRTAPISYLGNVVTFAYSYIWYTFREWEYLIDWMALRGINLVPSYAGQEEIYRKTFNEFGVDDSTFSSWTNGHAFLPWARGQNLHGCFGPLPLKLMRAQWELQKQILARLRDIGIVSVLPAFQGNVPAKIRDEFPSAQISQHGIAWIDGLDPLFSKIQKRFLEIMIEDWGTDNWYETDGYFNGATPPWFLEAASDTKEQHNGGNPLCYYNVDPTMKAFNSTMRMRFSKKGAPTNSDVDPDLGAMARSKSVFDSLAAVDPDAVWLYQGWIWKGWNEDHLGFMKGFVSGPPIGRLVLLDMVDEVSPEWSKFNKFGYFGVPFIWSVVHNFGGNLGMYGSLQLLNEQPLQAKKFAPSLAGIGAAPEAIDQNPVYYDLLFAMNWRQTPFASVEDFVIPWTKRRYGVDSKTSDLAWRYLLDTVYAKDTNERDTRSRSWPAEHKKNAVTSIIDGSAPEKPWFNLTLAAKAWHFLILAGEGFEGKQLPRTLNYDLADLGREVLAKKAYEFFETMKSASGPAAAKAANFLIEITLDMDDLLCSEPSFMLTEWLKMSERYSFSVDSQDDGLRKSLLLQSRTQTSTWAPVSPGNYATNMDYAHREWAGQLSGVYRLRHECFLSYAADRAGYRRCVTDASSKWVQDLDYTTYPTCVYADNLILEKSTKLMAKWFSNVLSASARAVAIN